MNEIVSNDENAVFRGGRTFSLKINRFFRFNCLLNLLAAMEKTAVA